MNDLSQIVEEMKNALLRKLGDEVDLIFQYGSHLKNANHRYSDVDISYIPVHETTWESITVMVGETLIDLYPIQWSHLERMADFNDVSSSVLFENRIVYQRTGASGERFRALPARLRTWLQPEARPQMVRKAQEIFQSTGYAYYLLRQETSVSYLPGCIQHSQFILRTVLHCLAVFNQACIDTRKIAQVSALPRLPVEFDATASLIINSLKPGELLAGCETLLRTTRDLLLSEQRQVLCSETTFPAVFRNGYPELRGDLQRVMQASERKDLFSLKTSLISLYHELSFAIARANSGVEVSSFNTLSEYEQDFTALGFPSLLPYLVAEDFDELHRQCLVFDERLREFLTDRSVDLNWFPTMDDLQGYLGHP